jgi:hypothetical protein
VPGDLHDSDSLRQVIIQQYLLHEVEHHALQAGAGEGDLPLVPVAHGLIDIYKCLHQGEFGVAHTIDHPEGFRQRLHAEVLRGPAAELIREPAVESVSADGGMLRVNLRALRTAIVEDVDRAVNDLALVCFESAHVTRGVNARFFETLDVFMRLNRNGEIALAGHVFAFPSDWVETFFFEVRELMRRIRQVPVFSHSESYRHLNRPSYRVVVRSVLEASPLAGILET